MTERRSAWALDSARSIMADLRSRGEFCWILGKRKPEAGPWVTLEMQAALEDRIAELVDAALLPRITGLIEANNREVERRRAAEAELRNLKGE